MTGTASDGRRWHGQLPIGLVGVAGAVFLLWRLATHTGLSGDVFWQWTAGQWMLAHHQLLTVDPFSYTVRGRPWFTEEWGYEVLLAGLVRVIGPVAFWILSAGVGSLAVLTVAWRVKEEAGWSWAGVLAIVLAVGLVLFQRDRPQEFSYWFFPLELLALWWWRRTPRAGVVLVVLMIVWANIHGSFLLGIGVLTLELLWSSWTWQWGRLVSGGLASFRRTLWLWILSVAATMLNPHGPSLWAYAFKVSTSSTIAQYILEWQSPNFHDLALLGLVMVPVALTILALLQREEPVAVGPLCLAGILLAATLDSVRFLPYFLVAWCVLTAGLHPWALRASRPTRVTWLGMAVVAGVLMSGTLYAPGTVSSGEPVSAVSYLAHRSGRIFADYSWGGYLIHEHIPVFIDGRTDMYLGTGILGLYIAVSTLTMDPESVFRDYNVRYVLWPPATPLATFLTASPGWKLIYDTPSAEIFEHEGSW